MEFLGNLGIDWKLLIAQIVNFGLLLWILTAAVYRPILRRIEKDEKILNEAQAQTRTLEEKQAAFAEQQKRDRTTARRRSKEIISEAERIADEIRERARAETEKEKQAVIKQIRSRLDDIDHAPTKKR